MSGWASFRRSEGLLGLRLLRLLRLPGRLRRSAPVLRPVALHLCTSSTSGGERPFDTSASRPGSKALKMFDPEAASRTIFMTGGAFTAGARDFLGKTSNPRLEKPFEVDAILAALMTATAS